MAISLFPSYKGTIEQSEDLILLVCKSDRSIKIYKISSKESTNNKIIPSLVANIEKSHPTTILSMSSLDLSGCATRKLIFTSSADAKFSVWLLETNQSNLEKDFSNILTPLSSFVSTTAAVNTIDCRYLGPNRILVATGGDDESIQIHLLEIDFSSPNFSSLKEISTKHFPFSARSAIKSIKICFVQSDDYHVLALSSDQRIYLWKSTFSKENQIGFELVSSSFVDISNIESFDVQEDFENKSLKVVVIGQGFQVLSFYL